MPELSAALPDHLRGDGPCSDCGTLNNIVWFTDNVLWNRVTGEAVVHEEKPVGVLCITCFVKRADTAGLNPTGWRLLPEWPWRVVSQPTELTTATPAYGLIPEMEAALDKGFPGWRDHYTENVHA